MAGLIGISYNGYGGSVFLMGWTGGYVILHVAGPIAQMEINARLIGDRYYSDTSGGGGDCLIFCSVTYVIG